METIPNSFVSGEGAAFNLYGTLLKVHEREKKQVNLPLRT